MVNGGRGEREREGFGNGKKNQRTGFDDIDDLEGGGVVAAGELHDGFTSCVEEQVVRPIIGCNFEGGMQGEPAPLLNTKLRPNGLSSRTIFMTFFMPVRSRFTFRVPSARPVAA